MRILIYEWNSFCVTDVCEALENMGHTYKVMTDEELLTEFSSEFDSRFEEVYADGWDCVLSFNYSPILSNNCKRHEVPYIAYVYDSPQVLLYSYTLINPCNHVFIFDRQQYLEFKRSGINTVYYTPLATSVRRMKRLIEEGEASGRADVFRQDISFVGTLYNEEHNFYDRLEGISDYARGYLESIMQAQMKVYGTFFLDKVLPENIIQEMQRCVPVEPNRYGVETIEYKYANYFLCRKMANIERTETLRRLSEEFNVNLFTINPTPELPRVTNGGVAGYYTDMPLVFAKSKINLNITLRSIRSGIPLRCMDIMGCGGFLLSNYQEDFYGSFVPGEDCVLYESIDDCVDKCRYYLSHEKEREQIAANGYGRICENHTYETRLEEIFNAVFN